MYVYIWSKPGNPFACNPQPGAATISLFRKRNEEHEKWERRVRHDRWTQKRRGKNPVVEYNSSSCLMLQWIMFAVWMLCSGGERKWMKRLCDRVRGESGVKEDNSSLCLLIRKYLGRMTRGLFVPPLLCRAKGDEMKLNVDSLWLHTYPPWQQQTLQDTGGFSYRNLKSGTWIPFYEPVHTDESETIYVFHFGSRSSEKFEGKIYINLVCG